MELRKITSTDNLSYIKFILLIFEPLVLSKLSSEELLKSGAIDYWVESALQWSDNAPENTVEMRLYSIELLTKLWRAYPTHIQEDLDKVNDIMTYIKRGIRDRSEVMRYTLLELLFNLLDQFAKGKNPYASIIYKKLTFLFIENHEETSVREFMLHNFTYIINEFKNIPIDIFLEPFVKQIKIRESKSYILNIFDMDFINIVVGHPKLKGEVALELFDLLAKTKLNNYEFAIFADQAMEDLLDRFLSDEVFLEYVPCPPLRPPSWSRSVWLFFTRPSSTRRATASWGSKKGCTPRSGPKSSTSSSLWWSGAFPSSTKASRSLLCTSRLKSRTSWAPPTGGSIRYCRCSPTSRGPSMRPCRPPWKRKKWKAT